MKFVQSLLASFRSKKQKPVEEIVIPTKVEPVQGAVTFIPTTTSKVSVISSEDNLTFNGEGFPVNIDENAHYITKRLFTPSAFYTEPPFLPWSEQERIKQNKNPVVNKDIDNNNITVVSSPEIVHTATINIINDKGEIHIYNGYPVEFKTDSGVKIAINNRGDYTFSTNELYSLRTETGEVICNGQVVKVLDCDAFDRERITLAQGVLLIV